MSEPIRTGSQGPLSRAPGESGVLLAGALAIVVHLVALVALTYGFHIQQTHKPPMSAELWAALPPPPRTTAEKPVTVPARPAPEPEPPRPKPKPVPPPLPKPVVPPPPKETPVKAPPKADIELKAKQALAAKRAEDEKRKLEETAKRAEDEKRKLEETRKRENEKLKAEAKAQAVREAEALAQKLALAKKEEQAKLAEAERLRSEQEALARRAAEAAASAQSKLVAAYTDKIRSKVRRFIVEPPGVPPTAVAVFEVVLIPGGDVLSVRLLKSSGNASYDEAAERAIRRAEPLPIPAEPQLFPQFRTLKLNITPKE